jgi:glyoxylase-like metal-dependent hydrolase (beta-lactamase superfamily II)/8-oxo-dGTP pyrophosphatase MutT (NUDIX family)
MTGSSRAAPTPKRAAAILLATKSGELLIGERAKEIAFLSGFLAFPGGRVDKDDPAFAHQLFGASDETSVGKAAALRELFEEIGLVFDGARAFAPADRPASAPEAYRSLDLRPDPRSLVFGGRWITPEFAPVRFDTSFYLAIAETAPAEMRINDREFAWASFVRPDAILERWRRHEWIVGEPTRYAIEVLALGLEEAPRRLVAIPEAQGGELAEFELLQGVRSMPLRTPTLPPARHTNAYIAGDERMIIVDPATYEESEREKLLEHIELHRADGASVLAIVLTHHHVDHVGAATWLKERLRCPIWAHAITKSLLRGKIDVDQTIGEGDRIDLGEARSGGPFVWEVIFTPGHDPGHIVLVDRRAGGRALIAGDMVAGIGTIIIDPPEGDMAEYVAQLRRLAEIAPEAMILPAHGMVSVRAKQKLEEYIAHRLMREEKVYAALVAHGRGTPVDLLERAYDDTNPVLYPLAARSCLAHLLKLVKDGRAEQSGETFSAY